jgi:eukaryotic-like serine/threonine-protein kinase
MSTPRKLGKFELIEEIGRGNMGRVFLGHDPFVDRRVAIKLAHAEQLRDEESGAQYRKQFFNEAHTAGLLTHPNIVSIYDAGVDGEDCYIVMEYVEGGKTLKQHCRSDSLLSIERVVEVVFKMAKALDYAHRAGVIHRDVKPSNVLVGQEMDVKLGDFGIAYVSRQESTGTMPMSMIGSPRYMSPEQLNEDSLTTQTDIFSLGVMMYELLTGRHPFAAESFSRLIHRILNEEPPPMNTLRADVPPVLEGIVRRAMAKKTADRYATALEFASDLSRAFDNMLERPAEQITAEERCADLKQLEFFRGFTDAEIWEIVRAGNWLTVEPGRDIIREGEIDDSFYVLIRGEVIVRKGNVDLRELARGDCFGEMGYLTRAQRTASIVAKTEAGLLKLSSTVINQVSLVCQVRFLKAFLRTMIQRLSATNERVSQQAQGMSKSA